MIRKEQEIRLRREVKDIVESHINKLPVVKGFAGNNAVNNLDLAQRTSITIENLIDDIMGAVNQEDNYRIKDYQDEIAKQRESMLMEYNSKEERLRRQIAEIRSERDCYKEKCSDTHKDEVIKSLEKKLGKATEKVRLLKRLVSIAMEEI